MTGLRGASLEPRSIETLPKRACGECTGLSDSAAGRERTQLHVDPMRRGDLSRLQVGHRHALAGVDEDEGREDHEQPLAEARRDLAVVKLAHAEVVFLS